MTKEKILDKEVDFFMKNLEEMLKEHPNKWTATKGTKMLGFYDDLREAYFKGVKKWGNVPILIRQVSTEYIKYGRLGKPHKYHSRVGF